MPAVAPPKPSRPAEIERALDGRWLAGVCAGLARTRGDHVGAIRAAFVVAVLAGGLGVLVYLACWLIIPGEGDADADGAERGVVVLAKVCGAALALAALAAVSGAATIFGFGAAVVGLAAVILVVALVAWPRIGIAWGLLPTAALALPALAAAAIDLRLEPTTGPTSVAPRSFADVPAGGYHSGLGTQLVDLRHTTFPASGPVSLKIRAGARRTIVALPHDRCVHVAVRHDQAPFVADVAGTIAGRDTSPWVLLFGSYLYDDGAGTLTFRRGHATPGPTLDVDFRSGGGSLYVRDYPDDIDPNAFPDWPGPRVYPEHRPDTTATPRKAAQGLVRHWRVRRRAQDASARRVNPAIPGPCVSQASGR